MATQVKLDTCHIPFCLSTSPHNAHMGFVVNLHIFRDHNSRCVYEGEYDILRCRCVYDVFTKLAFTKATDLRSINEGSTKRIQKYTNPHEIVLYGLLSNLKRGCLHNQGQLQSAITFSNALNAGLEVFQTTVLRCIYEASRSFVKRFVNLRCVYETS